MSKRLALKSVIGFAALAVVLGACSSSSDPAAPTTSAPEPSSSAPTSEVPVTDIRFALDWTPNTNHTGIYVAQEEGYFADAGLNVEILPYNNSSPDVLVGSGAAEFGGSFQDSATFSLAAGTPMTSVFAVLQHWATAVAVMADRDDIKSPKDLDGKIYAGFGGPGEIPKMKAVIQGDGGTGEFESVVFGTTAYDALYTGDVDFTEPFVAWEGIEAELRGQKIKTFDYVDYGFPDAYSYIVVGNNDWLEANPEAAAAFVQAIQKGYQFAADNPKEAAQILIDANPGVFTEEELVFKSQDMLSASYMLDADGVVGTQTLEQWTALGDFFLDAGVLVDADGKPVTTAPDYSTWFTNEYLAAS